MRQRKFLQQNLWASLPLPQFRLSPSMVQPPCLEPKATTDWGGRGGAGVCLAACTVCGFGGELFCWVVRPSLMYGEIQALAEKGGNSVFGLVAPPNPMCADPLRGFVFVWSRLQISQAWIWALLSGCASEIQPPGHPPARTRGRSIITARLIIIPTSERR